MAKLPIAPQIPRTFRARSVVRASVDYLLFLPADYRAKARRRWPLILFLHGSGERGRDLSKVAKHGVAKVVTQRPDFEFIVVSPQCPQQNVWSNDHLLALLDSVRKQYRVDAKRVYLTGLSMGGYAVWSLAAQAPEHFAAVAPVCGGGDVVAVALASERKMKLLKALPIWAFHGAKDELVPLAESERMVGAFRKIGNVPRLTVYPEAAHDSWTDTYANPELYRWFLGHRRR